ncbi:hypothetical protein HMPREF1982_03946 [Clostridiales bacterium oral taxon 876 str. F0540]|nr:hypothetical protein HMPREF1982_03946 [Clostridiales bacterium oral taxon 876 str. F0540]
MKVDYVISEIGSTTTVVTAFKLGEKGVDIIAQGKNYTTVNEGDVTIGVIKAIEDIEFQLGEKITWNRMLSTSSAAGGLKITVHGLVEDMTVKAAKEAALGAGGNIKLITAGKLRNTDIKRIKEIDPNLIMIAGGTDYGERETALYNAELLSKENLNKPFIYCGNITNQYEIKELFQGQELYIVDNVYPRIDELNVEPTRKIIQTAFENNITKASGMNKIKSMIDGSIMPTPGAVMESAKLLYEIIGDVVVFDVGGATTDVHSVTEGSVDILDILVSPEPIAKRTVEGDLGVYVNSENLINLLDYRDLDNKSIEYIRDNILPIPKTDEQIECSWILTKKAVEVALNRHVGYLKRTYGSSKNFIAYGKDLSKVKYIVGTGGALTRLPKGETILREIRYSKEDLTMLPRSEAKVLLDNKYIMACAGVLSKENKEAASLLLKQSLGIV